MFGEELGLVIDNIKATYIDVSQIHGKGLFSDKVIFAGEVLAELDGQQVSWSLFKDKEQCMEWNSIATDTLLVRPFRTKYSYINHSRTPNLKIIAGNPIKVVSKIKISPNEELTLDYRDEPLPKDYIEIKGGYL